MPSGFAGGVLERAGVWGGRKSPTCWIESSGGPPRWSGVTAQDVWGGAGAVQAGKGKLRGDVLVHSWGLQRRQNQAFLRGTVKGQEATGTSYSNQTYGELFPVREVRHWNQRPESSWDLQP